MPLRRRRGVKKLVVEQIQMAPHPACGHPLSPLCPQTKQWGARELTHLFLSPRPYRGRGARGQGEAQIYATA